MPNIHVIGDAAMTGAMPKAAFAANAQAKVCAVAVAALLRGDKPIEPRLINTCYSLVAPDYGISFAEVFKPANGMLVDVEGAAGSSPVDAPARGSRARGAVRRRLVQDDHRARCSDDARASSPPC